MFVLSSGEAISIIRELTEYAADTIAPGFEDIGKGIGAIMLLIVSLYYISSILDGGKFQIKMLLPFLIFLFVCNFEWISTPVTSFTTTITESLVETCDGAKASILAKNNCSETANINDMHNSKNGTPTDDEIGTLLQRTGEAKDEDNQEETDGQNAEPEVGKTRGLSLGVKRGMDKFVNNMSLEWQKEAAGESYANLSDKSSSKKHFSLKNLSFQSLISSVVSWVCDIMSYVLRAFGGVMSGLIVAFGPITFAFAIIPGHGGNIKSWIIRLCQFSLWAPICALIDCFSVKIFDMLSTAAGTSSILMTIAVAVCNLVALTSVPSIASMIIEGAQGAVSLSSGLQTIGGALTAGGSAAAAIGSFAVGRDNVRAAQDTISGMRNAGISGVAKDIGASGHTFKGMLGRMQASGRATRLGKR